MFALLARRQASTSKPNRAARSSTAASSSISPPNQRAAASAKIVRPTAKPFTSGCAAATWNEATSSASRSEEHTSELQSLMRISYAVFCLKKKTTHNIKTTIQYYTKPATLHRNQKNDQPNKTPHQNMNTTHYNI